MSIYLDNAATTKVAPSVQKEINKYFSDLYANPSSIHQFGLDAKAALTRARTLIAASINAEPNEIVFTGSGTEANNLTIKGLFYSHYPEKNHIITTTIEHDCVLNACEWLKTKGAEVTYLNVDEQGFVDPVELQNAITDKTFLVSIIHGNNEIGTIQDLNQLTRICHDKGVLFHSDACQSYTKVSINVKESQIDLLTINAHKIHGPKGVGALYVRKGIKLTPLLHGGGQEFGLRSSTENVPGIMGFAKAVETVDPKDIKKMFDLRDKFINEILKIDKVKLNGPIGEKRLCNNINVSFFMLEGELVESNLSKKGIFISTGSACSSSSKSTSPVMKAIKSPMEYLHGNIRISISKDTTDRELTKTLKEIKNIVANNNLKEI